MFRRRRNPYCMNNSYADNPCELQNDILEDKCNNIAPYYMQNDNNSCECGFDEENDNTFPENPMLAQSYVPIQNMDKTFKPCVGLKMGTIFPELVSPYEPCQYMEEIEFIRATNKIKEGCNQCR